ncbi:MAG: hypothetical protein JW913_03040 [Chitinispirillaceae bacterium]|nr:hypothetical protein [Chitinispirillaceae bacterium]
MLGHAIEGAIRFQHPTGDAILDDKSFRKDLDEFYKNNIDQPYEAGREHGFDIVKSDGSTYSSGEVQHASWDNPYRIENFRARSYAEGTLHYQQPTPDFPTGNPNPSVADIKFWDKLQSVSGNYNNYIANTNSITGYYAGGAQQTFSNLAAIRETNYFKFLFTAW